MKLSAEKRKIKHFLSLPFLSEAEKETLRSHLKELEIREELIRKIKELKQKIDLILEKEIDEIEKKGDYHEE